MRHSRRKGYCAVAGIRRRDKDDTHHDVSPRSRTSFSPSPPYPLAQASSPCVRKWIKPMLAPLVQSGLRPGLGPPCFGPRLGLQGPAVSGPPCFGPRLGHLCIAMARASALRVHMAQGTPRVFRHGACFCVCSWYRTSEVCVRPYLSTWMRADGARGPYWPRIGSKLAET